MLIPGKSHSRVESHNFRASIETLDVARVRTFCQHDRSWIAGGGAGGGRLPASPSTLFPADVGTPSIDRHGGQWRARNVVKRPGEGATGCATLKVPWRIGPGRRAGESPCPLPPPSDATGQSVAGGCAERQVTLGLLSESG